MLAPVKDAQAPSLLIRHTNQLSTDLALADRNLVGARPKEGLLNLLKGAQSALQRYQNGD